jgi:hypothetical protein
MTEPSAYWGGRRAEVLAWLPCAPRGKLEAFALENFDRAEVAAWRIDDEAERAYLLAQREASYAISAALDWSAQSRRPSFAELQRRRGVPA